jgi:hypothetical protein
MIKPILDATSQVPDSVKIVAAVSAPTLTLMGISVEQWTFILSGIVSVFFIIEKLPVFCQRMLEAYRGVKRVIQRK